MAITAAAHAEGLRCRADIMPKRPGIRLRSRVFPGTQFANWVYLIKLAAADVNGISGSRIRGDQRFQNISHLCFGECRPGRATQRVPADGSRRLPS